MGVPAYRCGIAPPCGDVAARTQATVVADGCPEPPDHDLVRDLWFTPPKAPPKSSDSIRPIFLLSTPPKTPPPACGRFELVREHLDVIVGPATDMRALHLHMYGSVNACVATDPGLLRGETQIMKHQVRSAVVALVAVAMVITLGNPANAEDTQSLTTSEVGAVASEPADPESLSEVPLTSDESLDPSATESPDPSTPESLDPSTPESLDSSMTKMSRGVPMAASPAHCSGMTTFASRVGSSSLVYGRTKCSHSVEAVGVTTYLWNAQWWGWNVLRTTSSSRRFSDSS